MYLRRCSNAVVICVQESRVSAVFYFIFSFYCMCTSFEEGQLVEGGDIKCCIYRHTHDPKRFAC